MSSDVVEIQGSKSKLAWLSFGAAVMTAPGVWIAVGGAGGFNWLAAIVGWLAVALCAAASLYGLARLMRPRPFVILSSKGIEDHETLLSAGFIGWSEVERLSLWVLRPSPFLMPLRFIAIWPRDTEDFLLRRPLLRIVHRLTPRWPPATISAMYLDVPLATLVKEIKARTETPLDPALEQIASPG